MLLLVDMFVAAYTPRRGRPVRASSVQPAIGRSTGGRPTGRLGFAGSLALVALAALASGCGRKAGPSAAGPAAASLSPLSEHTGAAQATSPPPRGEAATIAWAPVSEGNPGADMERADKLVLQAADLARSGHRTDAIARLIEAGNLSPNDAGIRGALARLLLEDGQLGRAIDEFKRALALRPTDVDNRFGLAAAFLQTGRPDEARKLLDVLATERPNDPRVQSMVALARGEAGDAAGALDALRAAASAEPQNTGRQAELGAALARDGKFGEALDALGRAAAAKPDDAAAQLQLGTALAQAGQHEQAEKALQAATRLAPDDARGWFNLGVLREERGDRQGAAEAYDSLLKNVKNGDPEGKLRERIVLLRAHQSGSVNGQTGSHQP